MLHIIANYLKQHTDRQINNINMTTSLPKIKPLVENSQNGSQKNLKFKKLKLTSEQSAAQIKQRFKSVRTQRLSSLQRYSSAEEQRQYKREKIHLNLLERKLLSGAYDQAKETGNDLNSLKQKTDSFKIQFNQKVIEVEKLKKLIEDVKAQIEIFQSAKRKNEQIISNILKKHENQKIKTDHAISERTILQHMISQRKKINLFYQFQTNNDKQYLIRLKAIAKQVQTQARQSHESMKNLQTKIEQLNENLSREQKARQQIMYDKQTAITKRKEEEKLRQEKSRQYKKSLDQAQNDIGRKDEKQLYNAVIVNIFFNRYSNTTLGQLQEKYQKMQNMYQQICSYRKFDKQDPKKMIDRFKQLQPEQKSLGETIKKLQEQQIKLEREAEKLRQKQKQKRIIGSIDKNEQNKAKIQEMEDIQKKLIQNQRRISNVINETKYLNEKKYTIQKWVQASSKQFGIKTKMKLSNQQISQNFSNLLKLISKQSSLLLATKKSNISSV